MFVFSFPNDEKKIKLYLCKFNHKWASRRW
jgi:hypothetical protein